MKNFDDCVVYQVIQNSDFVMMLSQKQLYIRRPKLLLQVFIDLLLEGVLMTDEFPDRELLFDHFFKNVLQHLIIVGAGP